MIRTVGKVSFPRIGKKYTSQQDLLLHLTTVDHFTTINLESALAKMHSENQLILHFTMHQKIQDHFKVLLKRC